MKTPAFLEEDLVAALQARLVATFGGLAGFNDAGLFASALNRPRDRWHYGRQDGDSTALDLFDLAAAYGYGLIKNHPFHDANKRTGIAACLLFLRVNGREIAVRSEPLVTVVVGVARGRVSEDALGCWLRRRAVRPQATFRECRSPDA